MTTIYEIAMLTIAIAQLALAIADTARKAKR